MPGRITVLGVCAHPDDLEFSAAGTFAKFSKSGAYCYYLICTDGSKGSNDPKATEKRLVEIRRNEQIAAGKIIGLKDVFFLKNRDAELVADLKLKKDIVRYIRKLKPDIVITTDPTFLYSSGFINHTDHRAAGLAAIDAVYPLARDRLTFNELDKEGLKPHRVKHIYLINFSNSNYAVDISDTMNLKLKALSCHRSQISKGSLEFVKKRNADAGKQKGCRYAETFFKIDLPG